MKGAKAPFFLFMKHEIILRKLYEMISLKKQHRFEEIAPQRTFHLSVVLENFQKNHNTGAILRTCDCLGIQEIQIIGKNLESVRESRISKGSENWLTINTFDGDNSTSSCIQYLREKGYKIVATSPNAENTIDSLSIDQPIALFFGTEREGISNEMMENCDELISLPMHGFTESYNVSVSAAIIISKLRNRLENSTIKWLLDKEQQTELKILWCEKYINKGERVVKELEKRFIGKE